MTADPQLPALTAVIENLIGQLRSGATEIYNEFSLQHELGILLRAAAPMLRIQFERNVSHFGFDKRNFAKREIDIVGFSPDRSDLQLAVELKFPRRGQYPEQMFSFCKDIVFLEQLKSAGFKQCLFLAVVDDKLFYEGSQNGIYSFFRGGEALTGDVTKPTGRRDQSLSIHGRYNLSWQPIVGSARYLQVEIEG